MLLWPYLSRAAADHQKTWEESRKNPRRAQGPSDKRKWDREMCEQRGLGISRVTEWHICSALQANRGTEKCRKLRGHGIL